MPGFGGEPKQSDARKAGEAFGGMLALFVKAFLITAGIVLALKLLG